MQSAASKDRVCDIESNKGSTKVVSKITANKVHTMRMVVAFIFTVFYEFKLYHLVYL